MGGARSLPSSTNWSMIIFEFAELLLQLFEVALQR
jgi:hypothetical protein